jgi:hypothetical protein
MSIRNPVNTAIRQAMASGQFQLAERLWSGYAARLKEELRGGALTKASLEEARELVEWSRLVVLCLRARSQARLSSLHIAGAYGSAPQATAPRLIQKRL